MDTTAKELAKLGTMMKQQLASFQTDRQLLERQWLKNLRQYQGKYDPEILNNIPDERSHSYPRDTRIKVKGGVAKLMEMMFPSQERNWELKVTTNPSIPDSALQEILNQLQSRTDEQGQPIVPTSDEIERAVRAWAETRKDNMEAEVADQLEDPDMDYPQMCKRLVRSGYIYGFGVARAPMVRTQTERMWVPDPLTGTYVAKTQKIRRPYGETLRVWDCYPDLTAKTWTDQEMFFERVVLSRHDFRKLGDRPDFRKSVIKEYLRNHPTGNYTEHDYEAELQDIAKTSNLADRTKRRYEVYRGFGFVSAHELQAAGVADIKEDEMDQDILADVWFIDDVVIKAEKAAFGERVADQYHPFIYAEDEDAGITGIGLPEEVRDSQMGTCAITRATMDNAAAIAGPILEVNVDLLPSGRKNIGAIHAFQTIEREGDGTVANYPAIRQVNTTSHIPELLSILAMQRQQLDIESNLPAYTMGNMQGQPLGEAFRTSNNMSMMIGAANMVTKDTVRAFDKFTSSFIGAFVKWNQEFNPKEDIKGDFQVMAKGNLSLVAKEVRGAALDQFVMTLTPEDRAILDSYGILIDRLKSRDLPVDRVLPREEAMKVLENMRQAQSQASQVEQGLTEAKTADAQASAAKKQADADAVAATTEAVMQELLSRVERNLAMAETSADKIALENLKMIMTSATKKPTAEGVQ